jgi:YD repeat-containing protein
VQTAQGERPIESLRAGDEVWAEDPETGEIALHEIARTFARDATDVLTVDIAEETASASRIEHVRVTSEHRWWTADRGWTESRALREGEPLGTRAEGRAWVFGVNRPLATEIVDAHRAFNIEVESIHTYFVGHGALWVHNACGGETPPAPGDYLADKAPKQVTPGTRTLEGQHVNDRGRVEPWRAHYDEYGRLVGRTDYNAGNAAHGIPDVHHHVYDWSTRGAPGRAMVDHAPGEYKP